MNLDEALLVFAIASEEDVRGNEKLIQLCD
jgi:hypothetical protein